MDNKYPIQINLYSSRMWSVWDQLPNIEWSIEKLFYFKLPKADTKVILCIRTFKTKCPTIGIHGNPFPLSTLLKTCAKLVWGLRTSRIVKNCQGLSTLRNVHLRSSTILSLIVVITIGESIYSSVVRTLFQKLQIRKDKLSWCSQVFSINNVFCYMPCSPGWPLELLNSSINSMQQGLAARFNC